MGLRTTVWGPCAWVFIHSLAAAVGNADLEKQMIEQFHIILKLMKDVLPCKHCRQSYEKFLDEILRKNWNKEDPSIRVDLFHITYELHNKVNQKLFIQDVQKRDYNLHKWIGYTPTESWAKQNVNHIDSVTWIHSTMNFFYYIVSDDISERKKSVYKFMKNTGILIVYLRPQMGDVWLKTLRDQKSDICSDKNIRKRLQGIRNLHLSLLWYSNYDTGSLPDLKTFQKNIETQVIV